MGWYTIYNVPYHTRGRVSYKSLITENTRNNLFYNYIYNLIRLTLIASSGRGRLIRVWLNNNTARTSSKAF